ncbi:hypothetical protein TNCV_2433291 [Trichonephila clavipes]|nr:hypothetical protein TNCV_2433291 [Trichonephila clavipes]
MLSGHLLWKLEQSLTVGFVFRSGLGSQIVMAGVVEAGVQNLGSLKFCRVDELIKEEVEILKLYPKSLKTIYDKKKPKDYEGPINNMAYEIPIESDVDLEVSLSVVDGNVSDIPDNFFDVFRTLHNRYEFCIPARGCSFLHLL